jgi:hypothetical protein
VCRQKHVLDEVLEIGTVCSASPAAHKSANSRRDGRQQGSVRVAIAPLGRPHQKAELPVDEVGVTHQPAS